VKRWNNTKRAFKGTQIDTKLFVKVKRWNNTKPAFKETQIDTKLFVKVNIRI
jgi:hypothetical protein